MLAGSPDARNIIQVEPVRTIMEVTDLPSYHLKHRPGRPAGAKGTSLRPAPVRVWTPRWRPARSSHSRRRKDQTPRTARLLECPSQACGTCARWTLTRICLRAGISGRGRRLPAPPAPRRSGTCGAGEATSRRRWCCCVPRAHRRWCAGSTTLLLRRRSTRRAAGPHARRGALGGADAAAAPGSSTQARLVSGRAAAMVVAAG